jgi:ATP-dependent Clp protease ATP-binding subunit ClpC
MAGTLGGVFERFTDRARSVLVMAQEEARQLNHSFIGSEHILLGLLRVEDGVGAQALTSLGVTHSAVCQKVEETIGMAGTAPSGSPPFTPRAKKVLELSLREALQLGHHYIGTEHILLGIVREGEGVAATVLVSLGTDLNRVRQAVMQLMSAHPESGPGATAEPASAGLSVSHRPRDGSEPRCPGCGAGITQEARFRVIAISPDDTVSERAAIPVEVVYCAGCGMTLHMFRSDDSPTN